MSQSSRADHLKPYWFRPGDPRINRSGTPPTFSVIRAAAQGLLQQVATDKQGKPVVDERGRTLTNLDVLLRKWLFSDDPRLQIYLVEVAYGKVPASIVATDADGNPQQITMIEVVKDRADGTTDTLRAIATSTDVDSLRRGTRAAINRSARELGLYDAYVAKLRDDNDTLTSDETIVNNDDAATCDDDRQSSRQES